MSRLQEKLESGQKVLTAEITPPKGAGIKKLISHAELLKEVVDAINITDCQRALVKMSSLAASRVLLDVGVEPVYQLTCRDRNSIALQSDLMGAWALKIPNLLCLTGDPVKVGDSPQSKSVFECEAVKLLELVGHLQKGQDASGHKLNAPTKFFVGAVTNPTLQNQANQLLRMEKKMAAGARFFQTQANYDLEDFAAFLKATKKLNTKVIAGILILHSYETAEYIHANIPGIRIPDAALARFRSPLDPEQFAVDFAVETMLQVEAWCDGFHVMSIRREDLIRRVIDAFVSRKSTPDSSSRFASQTIG